MILFSRNWSTEECSSPCNVTDSTFASRDVQMILNGFFFLNLLTTTSDGYKKEVVQDQLVQHKRYLLSFTCTMDTNLF